MNKAKRIICLFMLIIFLGCSAVATTSSSILDPVIRLEKKSTIYQNSSGRNLLLRENTWLSQAAVIFNGPNFEGSQQFILTGFPQIQYSKYVSFEVGSQATLRIIDYENEYVYRFEAGRKETNFEIDSANWVASVDHPIPNDDCVIMFQYPRYHGYFREYCINHNVDYWAYYTIHGKYSSITFGENCEFAVIFPDNLHNFLPLTHERSFPITGDVTRLILIDSIEDDESYVLDPNFANSNNLPVKEYYMGGGGGGGSPSPVPTSGITFNNSKLLLIAGYVTYAKAQGTSASWSASGKRPYMYFEPGETITLYCQTYAEYTPADNEVYFFANAEMFSTYVDYSYTGVSTDTYPAINFGSILLGSEIMGIVVGLDNGDSLFLRGGPTPSFKGASVSSICLVPQTPDDAVYIWLDPCFLDYQNDITSYTAHNWYLTATFSMVVGRNRRNVGVKSNDYLAPAIFHFPPGAYSNVNLQSIYNYYFYENIYDELKTLVDNDCIRAYDSADYFLYNYDELCTDESENFTGMDLSDVKYILFPSNPNFKSALLFNEQHLDEDKDYPLELNLIDNSAFAPSVGSLFSSITMIPYVSKATVNLYENSFYRGYLRSLTSSNAYISDIDTREVKYISALFNFSQMRVIDTSDRTVTTFTSDFRSHYVYEHNIFVQWGSGSLLNGQSNAIWTFDDNQNLYTGFTILYGRIFYDENTFSSTTKQILFPPDGSVFKVIAIDENGINNFYYFNGRTQVTAINRKRALVMQSQFDGVVIGEGPHFTRQLAAIEESSVIRLDSKRTYSFYTRWGISIYDMTQIGQLDWDSTTVDTPANNSIQFYDSDTYIHTFTPPSTGYYSINLDGKAPKSVLLDCVFIFDDCDFDASDRIRKYCTSNLSYQKIIIDGLTNGEIGVVISQPIEGSHGLRSYKGVSIAGQYVDKTKCIKAAGPTAEFYFKR